MLSQLIESVVTMWRLLANVLFLSIILVEANSARILGIYPSPSISHQVVFRALTLELVKRGHEVVVVTPDPVFKNKESPKNLVEIDTSDEYEMILPLLKNLAKYTKRGVIMNADAMIEDTLMFNLHLNFLKNSEVNRLLDDRNQKFDLVIFEPVSYAPLIFSEIFDAPAIMFSSLYGLPSYYETVGAVARHPVLYPSMFRNKFQTPGILEKIEQLYLEYKLWKYDQKIKKLVDELLKSRFGSDTPSVDELQKRVVLLLANSHPIFDGNRPVPPATVYLGGLQNNMEPKKPLPEDLQLYLDGSTRGVVYVSLGSNVRPSRMDKDFLDAFLDAFEKIPYDILWKFDGDDLERIPKNVKIQKWFPQRDMLSHPNIKLFVMQGGLQSTDEAIDAEVPLVGIPMMGDQWYNTNKYVELGVGVALDSYTMVAEDLMKAVDTVANNPSYKENMKKLKALMRDQPETPLQRAVWWTEHVLRHKGSRHLLGAAAHASWADYFMLDVLIPLAIGFTILLSIAVVAIIYVVRLVLRKNSDGKVKRH